MTACADKELWEDFISSPSRENKERLVKRYLPLVKYVAGRMTVTPPPGLDYDDILSFGVLGLLDAFNRFDISRGFSFQTFAVPRIRGAILDELRKYDWISRTGREKIQKLDRAMEKALQVSGSLEDDFLKREMGVDEKTYRETLELASRSYMVSLDEVLALDEGDVRRGAIVSDETPSSQEILEDEEEAKRVKTALRSLPEREALIISLYYYEGLTLREIGKVLGVTESRISQLHGKALATLRGVL